MDRFNFAFYKIIICKKRLLQMKNIFLLLFILAISCCSEKLFAQHDMKNMQMKKDTIPKKQMANMNNMQMKKDTLPPKQKHDMGKMDNMKHMGMMSHSFSRNLSMNRNGSGTSWLPDASPVYGHMIMGERSMFMLHGNIFLRYTNQDMFNKGSRGGSGFNAPN